MATAVFEINGQTVIVKDVDPHCTLLEWLRASGRTGAKEGCAEGECGACAVAFVGRDGFGRPRYETVNSCLVSLPEAHGRTIVSVEGLTGGNAPNELLRGAAQPALHPILHPVQQALVDLGGSQCGYCTPGFVMSLFSEYYRPGRTEYDPEAISGNLCRCTGYRPIVDAAKRLRPPAADDPWLEQLARGTPSMPALDTVRPGGFSRPQSLEALFEVLAKYPDAVLLAGGTDLMVDVNQRAARYPLLVSLAGVRELERFEVRPDEIMIGAGLTLSRLGERLQRSGDPSQTRLLQELLPLFSSRLIRNRATLGGNLATASPIGDAAPVLLALNAELTLRSASGEQRLALQDFFVDYRRTVLRPAEVIVSVHLPRPLPRIQRFYKVSKRRLDDISTVAGAFALDLDPEGRIERLFVAYGGVAAIPIRAEALEQMARGLPWSTETVSALCGLAESAGTPLSDHRGSADYRRAMMRALLERFHFETSQQARAAE